MQRDYDYSATTHFEDLKNPSEIGDAIYKVTDNDIFSKNRAEYKKQAFFRNSFMTKFFYN